MNSMLFVNVHVTIHVENYISSHITLENQAWISKLIQLLNTDNTIEMQKLIILIKGVFIMYKDVIFD